MINALLLISLLASGQTIEPELLRDRRVYGMQYEGKGVEFRLARQNDVLYPVQINNWWGHMAQDGDLVTRPIFDWTDYTYDGLTRAVLSGKTGYLNRQGGWLIDPAYDWADRFSENYAAVGKVADDDKGTMKFGYINKAGRMIVGYKFDEALRFREGFAVVRVKDRCYYVDQRGKVVLKAGYASARSFHEGVAAVQLFDKGDRTRPGRWVIIDKRGKVKYTARSNDTTFLGDVRDSLIRFELDRKWGYMDQRYRVQIRPRFDEARDFHNGVAAVKLKGKWGLITKTGEWAIRPQFDVMDDRDESLVLFALEGKGVGYIDRAGKHGISPQFAWGQPFFRGLARVAQPGGFGYINVAGQIRWDARAPLEGIIDLSPKGQFAAQNDPNMVGTRVYGPPTDRKNIDVPYEPDFLYDPGITASPDGQ